MFERYTERARRVVFFARYEANQLGSTTVETEHLLLGLVREDKNLMNRVSRNADAVEQIRLEIITRVEPRPEVPTPANFPLSDESERILSHAAREAEEMGRYFIGTEHLLLGILIEGESTAGRLLLERGLQLDAVREDLRPATRPPR